jgi:hypothetical protein
MSGDVHLTSSCITETCFGIMVSRNFIYQCLKERKILWDGNSLATIATIDIYS